jgi:DNA repair exonuclease SbcCD nuclease subunit
MKKNSKPNSKPDSKPIAIITADWHLTDNAWKWRPNLSGDALFGLSQICSIARKYGLPIIAAGDMFDIKRPPLKILLESQELLIDTQGYFVQGNHDKITMSGGSWFSLATADADWTNLDGNNTWGESDTVLTKAYELREDINTETIPFLNDAQLELEPFVPADLTGERTVWVLDGIDYTDTPEQFQERLNDFCPARNYDRMRRILVLHQNCAQIFGAGEWELDHGMIPDYYDFVICGHFHKAVLTTIRTRSGKEIPCLSPGGIHLLSIVEDPVKRLYFLCEDGAVYSKRLITRRVIRQDMQNATESQIRESLVRLVPTLRQKPPVKRPKELETPIVSVIYNANTVDSLKALFESVLKEENLEAHLFFKDTSDKDAYEIEIAGGLESETTLETGFNYAKDIFRQSEQDPHIRRIVESMLDNEPSQDVYETIKNEFLAQS